MQDFLGSGVWVWDVPIPAKPPAKGCDKSILGFGPAGTGFEAFGASGPLGASGAGR